MNVDAPLRIDGRGRTAAADDDRHVLNLLELLLFTNPGERVNRPEFGGGLRPLVFDANGPELAAALQFNLKANLARWLGDALDVTDLTVRPDDATLYIDVKYRCRRSGQTKTANFRREV